ncbi:MAG: hypothetical protein JSV46_05315 [Candidatus Aminicenantes bacterium]|nr:MAG: hypothetical protein JSV46_05315 [Candidatus Aminicenantes bacterium]
MNCQLNFSYSCYIILIDRGMEEATFKGEEKGDRPLFFRKEGQSLSSITKGLKGIVPEERGLPLSYPFFSNIIQG